LQALGRGPGLTDLRATQARAAESASGSAGGAVTWVRAVACAQMPAPRQPGPSTIAPRDSGTDNPPHPPRAKRAPLARCRPPWRWQGLAGEGARPGPVVARQSPLGAAAVAVLGHSIRRGARASFPPGDSFLASEPASERRGVPRLGGPGGKERRGDWRPKRAKGARAARVGWWRGVQAQVPLGTETGPGSTVP
jgi:hypothetical protein